MTDENKSSFEREIKLELQLTQLQARLAESEQAAYDVAGTIDHLKQERDELRSALTAELELKQKRG